jgi:hypothetical protein
MKLSHTLPALLLSLPALSAQAADPEAGHTLVHEHCISCHHSEVYTRPNRRVQDLNQLRTQVRRCELSLGLKWFDEEIDNATAYLNQNYYKFE